MSSINTNSLDVNYPIPGQNNSTQGFRTNFTNIKQNLDIAGNEISDLQNKAVLKSALANSVINNDMANTLIANAATLQFRATTYNLGNALVGNVLVNCSLGDVQYGTLSGNITLNFGSWAPTNTQGHVELQFARANANVDVYIKFPSDTPFRSIELLENYEEVDGVSALTFPYGSTRLNLLLTSNDCGNSIFINPVNRPFKSTQIQYGVPPSTGRLGDTNGTIYMPDSVSQLVVTGANTDPYFTTSNTASLYTGLPVVFTGTSIEANIVVGNTYYIRNVVSNTAFTVSSTINGSNVAIAANVTSNMYLNPVSYVYVAVDDYNSTALNESIDSTTSPNIITVISSANLQVNNPIIFTTDDPTGNIPGVVIGYPYYIKTISGPNITISTTRYDGIAGPEYQGITDITSSNVDCDYTTYNGSDIFRRIPLQPF